MTPQEQAVIESELQWYFLESDGECGVRSIQSGFESQMEARSMVGSPDGCMHVKETRSSNNELDGLPANMVAAAHRASRIHQRLGAIGTHNARTLELAFACTARFYGVSVSLACETEIAVRAHAAARVAVIAALNKRLERTQRHRPGRTNGLNIIRRGDGEDDARPAREGEWYNADPTGAPAKRRHLTKAPGMTPRAWLILLITESEQDDRAAQKELLARIVAQAQGRLQTALLEYYQAGRRAA